MTHYSAKVHGLRSAKNNTLTLSPEGVGRAKELRDSGYAIPHIVKVLSREGYTCQSQGRKEPQPITKWVLGKLFQGEKAKLLEVVLPREATAKTSWEVFAEERLEKVEGNPKANLWAKEIYRAYADHCRLHGEQPCSKLVVGLWLKTRFPRRFIGGNAQYRDIGWKA